MEYSVMHPTISHNTAQLVWPVGILHVPTGRPWRRAISANSEKQLPTARSCQCMPVGQSMLLIGHLASIASIGMNGVGIPVVLACESHPTNVLHTAPPQSTTATVSHCLPLPFCHCLPLSARCIPPAPNVHPVHHLSASLSCRLPILGRATDSHTSILIHQNLLSPATNACNTPNTPHYANLLLFFFLRQCHVSTVQTHLSMPVRVPSPVNAASSPCPTAAIPTIHTLYSMLLHTSASQWREGLVILIPWSACLLVCSLQSLLSIARSPSPPLSQDLLPSTRNFVGQ